MTAGNYGLTEGRLKSTSYIPITAM